MKRILLCILVLCAVMASCITVIAADDSWVKGNEFSLVSYHTLYNHVGKESFDETVYTITENAVKNNIKYVSFLGRLTNLSEHTYKSVITEGGKTMDDLILLQQNDRKVNKQWESIKSMTEFFTELNIPYGLSYDIFEYYGGGSAFVRDSSISTYFQPSEIFNENAVYSAYDDYNYYTIVENNGVKYIIYQLEIMPREKVLDWFNDTLSKNTDKYAIVYIPSFLDLSGELFTMWDWATTEKLNSSTLIGTSRIRRFTMAHVDKPRDGQAIWDYAFSKHDNILAVIGCNEITSPKITTKTLTNNNGCDTVAVVANSAALDKSVGPYMLVTTVSEDNKTFTFRYYCATKGFIDGTKVSVTLSNIGTLTEPTMITGLPTISLQQNGANKAYILGYEGNLFKPNNNMTRAEACTIFARLLLDTQTIPDGYTTRFTDVQKGAWYYNAIAYLDEKEFFFKNKNTEYKPNEPITRAEFVDLAYLASNLIEGETSISFNDVPDDHFYYSSIIAAASSGLVNGYEDGTFRPDNTITRAEVVTVVNRLLNLVVRADTVLPETLENTFVDINNHWAKLNILMASNSNVQTKSQTSATLNGVTDKGSSIVFENKWARISVNKKTGQVEEIITLSNGENILEKTKDPQFVYLSLKGGAKSVPKELKIVDNRIKVTFKSGDIVYLIADIRDDFMAFELDSAVPPQFESLTFANVTTNLPMLSTPESYRLGSMAMTANVFSLDYGMGLSNSTYALVYTKYSVGTLGSKHGFAISTYEENANCLQKVAAAIDRTKGLANTTGGPYSKDSKETAENYLMVTDATMENMVKVIDYAKEFNITQIDIHHGGKSFRQGDFYFPITESGTAKEFGDTVGKYAKENGIKLGLHVYAFYLEYDSTEILSNPKWIKQLETMPDVYTLRKDLTNTKESVQTVEDASGFDMTKTFFYRNSRYILIDEEIILVGQGTPSGFINCKRAQCGSARSKHKAGTKIYHLSGYFNRFVPQIGSELFYHMADLTAQVYNDGGFSMIYLDAIDGLSKHDGATSYATDHYFYFHAYTQRLLSQCHDDPIIEFSSSAPQVWNVRGRIGAWDIPTRGYKPFIKEHITTNLKNEQYNYVSTLGWIHFFPDKTSVADMRNVIQKTMFRDDIDYIGTNGVLYNMSNVLYSFDTEEVETNPEYKANLSHFGFYNKIRLSDYFTDETKQKVIERGSEFKIIEKAPNEYAFLEVYYNKKNVGNVIGDNTFTGNNPFKEQTPYVRIEGRWSTLSENEITVAEFDETKTLAEQTLTKKTSVNLLEHMALKLKVKGTGNEGDAILISLKGGIVSGETGGHIDHFIDLNFEGWKEFVIMDADNGDYDYRKYVFEGIGTSGMQYGTYRVVPSFANIIELKVITCGDTAKNASISTVKAYKQTDAPIKNPTVTVGGSSITFNTTIKGSEYLEYIPEENKAYLHRADQTVTEVITKGTLTIPSGNFNGTYTGQSETNAPVRAKVVLGFSGIEITN